MLADNVHKITCTDKRVDAKRTNKIYEQLCKVELSFTNNPGSRTNSFFVRSRGNDEINMHSNPPSSRC